MASGAIFCMSSVDECNTAEEGQDKNLQEEMKGYG